MDAKQGFSRVGAKRGAPLIDRLMARVHPEPNSGCWLWTGGLTSNGYGMAFLPGGKVIGAHRAMLIAEGVTLGAGDHVCHRCDNPPCVNPDHLFVSTQAGNLADMVSKGRHTPAHAIPPQWRERIRNEGSDLPAWALAAWFGVNPKTIRNIRNEA